MLGILLVCEGLGRVIAGCRDIRRGGGSSGGFFRGFGSGRAVSASADWPDLTAAMTAPLEPLTNGSLKRGGRGGSWCGSFSSNSAPTGLLSTNVLVGGLNLTGGRIGVGLTIERGDFKDGFAFPDAVDLGVFLDSKISTSLLVGAIEVASVFEVVNENSLWERTGEGLREAVFDEAPAKGEEVGVDLAAASVAAM